ALLGKIPLGGKSRFGSTGQAAHIHIQHLVVRLVIMLRALAVLAIDTVHRVFHLLHILGRTGIQRVLHHRLLGTAAASRAARCKATSARKRVLISTKPWAPASRLIKAS